MIPQYLKEVTKNIKLITIKSDISEHLKSERAIVHYISTPDLDRHRDILNPKGMDDSEFVQAPSVWYNHNYKYDPNAMPIAKSLWRKKQEAGVLTKTVFATTAQANDAYLLHSEGFINTWSVGITPKYDKEGNAEKDSIVYDEKKKITTWEKWKMFEYSSAPLPANVYAQDQIKAMGEIELESVEYKNFVHETILSHTINARIEQLEGEMAGLKMLYDLVTELLKNKEVVTKDVEELKQLIKEQEKQLIKNISIELPVGGFSDDRIKTIVKNVVDGGR